MMERCYKRYELFPTTAKKVPARLPLRFQPAFLLTQSLVAVWHQNVSVIQNAPREGGNEGRGNERQEREKNIAE